MRINRVDSDRNVVLRLEGDIDEEGIRELRLAFLNCLKDGRSSIVVNMEGVGCVSYMGVGVLVERLRQFRALSGDIKLVNINLYCDRLFRMVGVKNLFELYESEAQALQVFQEAA